MALSDVAATLATGLPHQTCGTCHALAQMSGEEAATLRRLLADKSVRIKALADAMRADEDTPTVEWQALSRHARGGCAAKEHLR